jgi:hypothetical protein
VARLRFGVRITPLAIYQIGRNDIWLIAVARRNTSKMVALIMLPRRRVGAVVNNVSNVNLGQKPFPGPRNGPALQRTPTTMGMGKALK